MKKITAFITIFIIMCSLFFTPFVHEVEASGGYKNILQYTKTQTYLGDSNKTYYSDLSYSGYVPKITSNIKGNVGFMLRILMEMEMMNYLH